METIRTSQVKNMETEEIYDLLLPEIEKLYEKYNYVSLPKEQLEDMFLDAIEEIVYPMKRQDIDIEKLLYQLEVYLVNYLRSMQLLTQEELIPSKGVQTYTTYKTRKLLTKAEEKELISLAKCKDKDAMESLIKHNIGMIHKIAKHLTLKSEIMDFYDLMQEGILCLYQLVQNYDETKDVKFSSYASKSIFGYLSNAITKQDLINPSLLHEIKEYRSAYSTLVRTFEEPTLDAIATETSIPYDKVKLIHDSLLPLERLDAPGNDGIPLIEQLEDKQGTAPFDYATHKLLQQDLEYVLNKITPAQRETLLYRYGFMDGKNHTLKETGKFMGCLKTTASARETDALRELRRPYNSKQLRYYLDD